MPGEYTEFDRGHDIGVTISCACHCMTNSEAMPFARGVCGHAPQRRFEKMLEFDIFW